MVTSDAPIEARQQLPAPNSLRAWVLAARVRTLTAALSPVWVGSACAALVGKFRWDTALAAALGAVLLQVAANLANDAFDYDRGSDSSGRLGPPRAAQLGLLSSRQLRVGTALTIGVAMLVGVYLTWAAGWVVVAIGLASIAGAVLYTGGPYPLAYHGLGDVFVMVFFGFVAVLGTVWVQAASIPSASVYASVAVGSLATAILVVNHVRDEAQDKEADKRTLVVLLGRTFGVAEYAILVACAHLVPVVMWVLGISSAAVLAALLTAPWAFRLGIRLRSTHGTALNPVLASTAALLAVNSALLGAGLLWN